jgi:type VII secretion protein EccB, Actinobacterial
MASRRDQIQSQQFAVQRAVTALVTAEADPIDSPLRRLPGAALGSVMVAVICLAAVGIFGIVTNRSSSSWREGGTVVVERESGAVFVVMDGLLRPAANLTSAVLLTGTTRTTLVSRSALASMPRGPMVGIPHAPESLPPVDRLITQPWSICSTAAQTASGGADARSTLYIGSDIEPARALGDDEALLVRLPNGETYHVVWRGHRYRIVSAEIVLDALAWTQAPVLAVSSAWLNALPVGRDIAPLNQNNRGQPFDGIPEIPDARVGQVLVVETAGEEQYYLVGERRLRPISPVEAAIVLADPATRVAYGGAAPQARPLSVSGANQAPRDDARAPEAIDPPSRRPTIVGLARPNAPLCARFPDGTVVPAVYVDATPPAAVALPTERRTQRGVSLVEEVVIAPGHGAIVVAEPTPDAPATTAHLVTDLGIRYPVPSPDVLSILGYGQVTPVRLPAGLVARLPEGPSLDPAAAGLPVSIINS